MLITLAGASAIPARFASVCAPSVQPQEFHVVAEVYLVGTWHLVDATRMAAADQIARIGVGLDAAEVAFLTSFGPTTPQVQMSRSPRMGSSSPCVSRSDRVSQIEGIRPWYRRSIGLQPPASRLVRSASLRRVHGSYLADWLRMAPALSAGRPQDNDMAGGAERIEDFPAQGQAVWIVPHLQHVP